MLDCESGSGSRKTSESRSASPNRALSKLMNLDFPAGRRLSQLLPPRSETPFSNGKRSMSSRLSAGQMSFRRLSNSKKSGPVSSGRSLLAGTLRVS